MSLPRKERLAALRTQPPAEAEQPPDPLQLFVWTHSDDYTFGMVLPLLAVGIPVAALTVTGLVALKAAELFVGTPITAVLKLVRTGRPRPGESAAR